MGARNASGTSNSVRNVSGPGKTRNNNSMNVNSVRSTGTPFIT